MLHLLRFILVTREQPSCIIMEELKNLKKLSISWRGTTREGASYGGWTLRPLGKTLIRQRSCIRHSDTQNDLAHPISGWRPSLLAN